MKNIKSIIFDLGAVLLNIDYQKTIDEFEKLGVTKSNSFYSKKTQINIFNQLECGKISEKKFVKEIQKHCNKANYNEIIFAWNALLLDLPEKRVKLLKAVKQHYNIFLLSNTNSIHISEFKNQIGENRYLDFYNSFDKVYYSHEIGFRKPNKESFQKILEENNLNPTEVFFIDDSPQHIEGAKKLGIQTYHLKENEELINLFSDITQ